MIKLTGGGIPARKIGRRPQIGITARCSSLQEDIFAFLCLAVASRSGGARECRIRTRQFGIKNIKAFSSLCITAINCAIVSIITVLRLSSSAVSCIASRLNLTRIGTDTRNIIMESWDALSVRGIACITHTNRILALGKLAFHRRSGCASPAAALICFGAVIAIITRQNVVDKSAASCVIANRSVANISIAFTADCRKRTAIRLGTCIACACIVVIANQRVSVITANTVDTLVNCASNSIITIQRRQFRRTIDAGTIAVLRSVATASRGPANNR